MKSEVNYRNPQEAEKAGIGICDKKGMRRKARETLEKLARLP